MGKRPTILDVARAAGVSKSTVSLVLQSSPLVKPATAEAVRAAMAETGYVYNRAAASLRSTGVGLVGLVINDLRNPFFTEFATSFQMALSARGFATVISNTDEDPALQDQLVGSMIEHGVSALVLSPAYGETAPTFDRIARAQIPALQVLRQADPRTDLFPFSSFDYARGSAEATAHLIAQGCRRIAFAGGAEERPITEERRSGYLAELARAGLAPHLFGGTPTRSFGRRLAETLSRDHPGIDGVVSFNDQVALGLLAGFARQGRAVGRDIRLTGFDDIEDCAEAWPPVTSVACDIAGFGAETARRLTRWLDTGLPPPPETRAPVRLVARASSLGA